MTIKLDGHQLNGGLQMVIRTSMATGNSLALMRWGKTKNKKKKQSTGAQNIQKYIFYLIKNIDNVNQLINEFLFDSRNHSSAEHPVVRCKKFIVTLM